MSTQACMQSLSLCVRICAKRVVEMEKSKLNHFFLSYLERGIEKEKERAQLRYSSCLIRLHYTLYAMLHASSSSMQIKPLCNNIGKVRRG